MGRKMEWAAQANHMGGLPRKLVFMAVGAFAKTVANFLNTTYVHNADTLIRLVHSRPCGVPLLTVSNHMSTLDDPVMWGFKGFPTVDAKLARWVLAAEDICFKNPPFSYVFRLGKSRFLILVSEVCSEFEHVECFSLHIFVTENCNATGKCIPITRGGGIYQEHMNEAIKCLSDGEWLHTFPEGKVSQEDAPIRRLKWGTASLIDRAPVTPIVVPIVHHGFQEVMPENFMFGRRAPFPLCNKHINIVVGEPIKFDLPKMRQLAISKSRDPHLCSMGWPGSDSHGMDEAARRYLYSSISDKILTIMENLRSFGRSILK